MQFHLNGFRAGDPTLCDPAPGRENGQGPLPDMVDVLIIGSGPAGLTLAAQLAGFPDISTRIIERKLEPMEKGQADGISCRSMEMFEAFGFADAVMKEGYRVNEVTFWKPDEKAPDEIARSGRVQDVEEGLSPMPHVILNQARVHDMYLDIMAKSPSRLEVDYGWTLDRLTIDETTEDYPVTVTLSPSEGAPHSTAKTLRARYVVGCDGARSQTRKSIGRALKGDSANQAWGVMDVLPVTDFPDIRYKSLIKSNAGNIVIIPREGGNLARIYIELDKLEKTERVGDKGLTLDDLVAAAQRIFRPYTLDVRDVAWWSVYEIGQRLTDKFDDVKEADAARRTPRVFIAGDACHTHSPKAGQGMNVSMGDAFNLGWKLIHVLEGRARPELLHSYSAERQAVAQDLIDFDREWARIMSKAPDTAQGGTPDFQAAFIENGRYTAGMSVTYAPSVLTGGKKYQALAPGFEIGARFHSAPVTRIADGLTMELGACIQADARWRIMAFAPHQAPLEQAGKLASLCEFLTKDPASPITAFGAPGADPDEMIDLRAVYQGAHHSIDLNQLPGLLLPRKGALGLIDYEKAFSAATKTQGDIFDLRRVNREEGCAVFIRPDQYVAHVLPLEAQTEIAQFFAGIFKPL